MHFGLPTFWKPTDKFLHGVNPTYGGNCQVKVTGTSNDSQTGDGYWPVKIKKRVNAASQTAFVDSKILRWTTISILLFSQIVTANTSVMLTCTILVMSYIAGHAYAQDFSIRQGSWTCTNGWRHPHHLV